MPLLTAGISSAETAPAQPAAVVVETEKSVEVQMPGAGWKPAKPGLELATHTKLRTGEFSRALLRVTDFGVMRIDELTTIEVTPAEFARKAHDLDLKQGGFYFLNRDKPQELQIRTASANGAMKGTEFAMRVGRDGKTTVAMFEGQVELSNAQGSVLLKSGEMGEAEIGRKPRLTSKIVAVNIIQWCLYYPGVLDPADFGARSSKSLDAYRAGDLPRALATFSDKGEPLLRAALILSSGQVEKARAALGKVRADDPERRALERMIAAVQFREWTGGEPRTASEWVAESYYKQSRGDLEAALLAAQKAIALSPEFGFAWVRAAEMEFSFGRTMKAMKLLERGLELSPRNAQAHALQGFLLAAENHTGAARREFDTAIEIDGALGNAWLGRGLVSIRQNHETEGRRDLQIAAALEPNRSLLRSYLGKAFSQVGRKEQAEIELTRAREIDPADPTPWLYSAIQRKQENRYNEAIDDLEKSAALNDNRSVFRSQFLLDQDRSIRGTNLAAIYENNGLAEQSVREAVRAVDANYTSAPAHLFLANSYDSFRDLAGVVTRYEAGFFGELLVSNLLGPVGGGPLSQFVSQQEYSKLFEKDGVGFSSNTQYFSSGELRQTASQFGTVGNLSYALDGFYIHDPGQRVNNHFTTAGGFGTFKLQLTPRDTVFFQTEISDTEGGDRGQRFDPDAAKTNKALRTLDFEEKQDPGLLLLGFHHEWNPANHTLLLLGRLANRQVQTAADTTQTVLDYEVSAVAPPDIVAIAQDNSLPRGPDYFPVSRSLAHRGVLTSTGSSLFDSDYRSSFEIKSAELQHILSIARDTLILGARYQSGEFHTRSLLTLVPTLENQYNLFYYDNPPSSQDDRVDYERLSLYAYNQWHVTSRLSVTGGVVYDHLDYPDNFRNPPTNGRQTSLERVSPKAGFILEPWRGAVLRGAYSEAVSGTSFDESVRLEPTQVAGFLQSYRNLISESVIGGVAGGRFRLSGLSFEQKLPTRTYLGVEFNVLEQKLDRTIGVIENLNADVYPVASVPSSMPEHDKYRENLLTATVNQLIGDEWSVGLRYRFSQSKLKTEYSDLAAAISRRGDPFFLDRLVPAAKQQAESELQHLSLFALYNHRSGFFARAEANWYRQTNEKTADTPTYYDPTFLGVKTHVSTSHVDLPGDDFWQFNVQAGYRFHRNLCEISCGLLNITNEDYRLSPLNPYEDLPRDRTLVVGCRLNF